jgi:hypothetical protein
VGGRPGDVVEETRHARAKCVGAAGDAGQRADAARESGAAAALIPDGGGVGGGPVAVVAVRGEALSGWRRA